jgi:hypothetical protein
MEPVRMLREISTAPPVIYTKPVPVSRQRVIQSPCRVIRNAPDEIARNAPIVKERRHGIRCRFPNRGGCRLNAA